MVTVAACCQPLSVHSWNKNSARGGTFFELLFRQSHEKRKRLDWWDDVCHCVPCTVVRQPATTRWRCLILPRLPVVSGCVCGANWEKKRERERMIYLKAELLFIDANEQQLGHSFSVVSLFIITAFAYHRYLVFAPTKTTTTTMMMMVILPPCLSVCLFLLFSSIVSTL